MDIKKLLAFTLKQGASDLHLSSGMPPLVRLHGDITKVDVPPFQPEDMLAMLHTIMKPEQQKEFAENLECDFAITLAEMGRFRVNVFMQSRGPAAVLRTIPTEVPTLAEMNMPPILAKLADKERGLILVTGPTGSGKSTTLAAMINHINETKKGHIITVEDPIEFLHKPKSCLINQREVGAHTRSFANALRSALREDPDTILVGELRDLITTQLAITAAETGHVVFATLHTNSAIKTVDRVIDVFPAAQQAQIRSMFSESIVGIVSQTLLKKKDGKGRACAQEILVANQAVRNLIREEKTAQMTTVLQTGSREGMQSMDQALKKLVLDKVVDVQEASEKSPNSGDFLAKMGEGGAGESNGTLRRAA